MKKKIDMLSGPLAWPLITYAVPIMLTSVLQLLFNAADLVVVGAYCGSFSVAAVGATGAITNLIVNLFIGLSVGTGVAVAHGIGSREWDQVRNTVHTAVPMALVSGLFLTVLGVGLSRRILWAMGTPEEVLGLAATYMEIYFLGITAHMLYNFCASMVRAAGDTKSPLVILTAAGVVNVGLNILFVRYLGRNVDGVALATVLSETGAAIAIVILMVRRTDNCRLELRKLRFHKEPLKKMLRIGIPAGIQSCMFSLSNVLLQSAVNSFGAVAVSGNAAVANLEGFMYVIENSFHQTAVNFVGQNCGALQFRRVKKVTGLCMLYAAVAGILFGGLMCLFGPQLLSLYITDSPEAIAIGISRMLVDVAPYFLFGLQDVVTGALRGIGASFVSMILTVLGICGIRVLWIYTVFQIPRFHSQTVLYVSYPLSWIVTLIIQLTAFYVIFRRLQKRCAPEEGA
ncbi:MAG: MATE family efflux transporter [Oscillospiraceae bacterium]|nr:MATE family efflux transporter [Oscillospiraceae bacterium]